MTRYWVGDTYFSPDERDLVYGRDLSGKVKPTGYNHSRPWSEALAAATADQHKEAP